MTWDTALFTYAIPTAVLTLLGILCAMVWL